MAKPSKRKKSVRRDRKRLSSEFSSLTNEIGVYALCDLDNVPIYVGQTTSKGERGIQGRVRRHLTSARSDIIANRQADVWELAFVRAWPMPGANDAQVEEMERVVYLAYQPTIIAGQIKLLPKTPIELPAFQEIRILEPEDVEKRRDPFQRLPRAIRAIDSLLDVIIHVKASPDQLRALQAQFQRLGIRYAEFLRNVEPASESE